MTTSVTPHIRMWGIGYHPTMPSRPGFRRCFRPGSLLRLNISCRLYPGSDPGRSFRRTHDGGRPQDQNSGRRSWFWTEPSAHHTPHTATSNQNQSKGVHLQRLVFTSGWISPLSNYPTWATYCAMHRCVGHGERWLHRYSCITIFSANIA